MNGFFKQGLITAIFQVAGMTPLDNDRLTILVTIGRSMSKLHFKTEADYSEKPKEPFKLRATRYSPITKFTAFPNNQNNYRLYFCFCASIQMVSTHTAIFAYKYTIYSHVNVDFKETH